MELTREQVAEEAAAYAAEEAPATVEEEQLEGLPGAFAAGELGSRYSAWVVRRCFRRYLADYPDERRRAYQAAFCAQDYEAAAGANYFITVPMGDDVMLNYQSNSYHDAATLWELFDLGPTEPFAD
jgi:hypothetical protein